MGNVIDIKDVSMRFIMEQERTNTLKEYMVKLVRRKLRFSGFEALPEHVARYLRLNPLHVIIYLFRQLMLYGHVPPAADWLYAAAASLVMFALGSLLFDRMRKDFIYYI